MFAGLLQPAHLVLLLIVLLVVLGPGRIRGVGRVLGQSVRELVAGLRGATALPRGVAPETNRKDDDRADERSRESNDERGQEAARGVVDTSTVPFGDGPLRCG